MIISDILDRVKRQFGDESGVQVTNEDIFRWVNDGQRQIVMQNETLLEKIATAASVENQQEYSLPSDLLVLKGIQYQGPGETAYVPLKGYSLAEFNEFLANWDETSNFTLGTPVCYTIYASKIKTYPVPDHSLATAFKIYYNKAPTAVSLESDTPELPVLYHELLVKYCLQQAYELDEDWDASGNKASELDRDLQLLRGREDWKTQEHYPTITVLNEDGW